MAYYTMHLDTEGRRGGPAREVAYLIREKNTKTVAVERSACFAPDPSDKEHVFDFFTHMRGDMERYGINHINTWGMTDFSSLVNLCASVMRNCHEKPKKVSYRQYASFVTGCYDRGGVLGFCLGWDRYRNAYAYCERVYAQEKGLREDYLAFWESMHEKGGLFKLQNLMRYVLEDVTYEQGHTALADCYDAQTVTIFFSIMDSTKTWG